MNNFQNSSTVNPVSTLFIGLSECKSTRPKFLERLIIIGSDIMDL